MVKILVDSASDVTEEEAKNLGISMLSMEITFGDETFLDGVNLSHERFFEMLIESADLPKTSQINEFRFNEEFEKLTSDGSELVVITLSSKLSGTYNCARNAAKNYAGKVFVVDSLQATIGIRILCEYAIRLVKEGRSAKDIAKLLDDKKAKIKLMAVLGTLKYLKKGGRISSLVAFAGEMLSIKPVVSVVNGEVKLVGKAMGSKKGNNLLTQLVEKSGGIDFSMPYALAYSGLSSEYLNKYLKDSKPLWEEYIDKIENIPSYMIGSTIGTHVGLGAVAVAFFAK